MSESMEEGRAYICAAMTKEQILEEHITILEDAMSDLMKDYAKRVRNGAMLKPYLRARRLLREKGWIDE